MTLFTKNPLERLMMQRPYPGKEETPRPIARRGISAMAAGGMGWSASVPATVTPTYGKRRCGKSRSCLCNFSMTCPKPLVFCT